jgi:hypothetical protein
LSINASMNFYSYLTDILPELAHDQSSAECTIQNPFSHEFLPAEELFNFLIRSWFTTHLAELSDKKSSIIIGLFEHTAQENSAPELSKLILSQAQSGALLIGDHDFSDEFSTLLKSCSSALTTNIAATAKASGYSQYIIRSIAHLFSQIVLRVQSGKSSFRCLRFEPVKSDLTLSVLSHDKIPDFARLHEHIFHSHFDEHLFAWRYTQRQGVNVCAWDGDTLVAHYGVVPRQVFWRGRILPACQNGDVMVAEAYRGRLTRKGAFFLTATAATTAVLGHGKLAEIGYGFPNRRAFLVAERLGIYAETGIVIQRNWIAIDGKPSRCIALTSPEQILALSERFAKQMRQSLSGELIIPDYGSDYIQWRFLQHPHRQYQFLKIRSAWGKTLGLAICSPIEAQKVELLAILTHQRHFSYCVEQAIQYYGASIDCYAWLSNAAANIYPVGIDHDIEVAIPAVRQNQLAGIKPEEQRDCWWLTGADTDFK